MKKSLVFLVLLAFSIASSAKDEIKCNSSGTQQEMNACASNDLVTADRELNQTYKALLEKESKNVIFVQKLRAAQKAWIAFRNAELEAMYACEEMDSHVCWGSMQPMCFAGYKTFLTRQRTERLKEFLDEGQPADGCH